MTSFGKPSRRRLLALLGAWLGLCLGWPAAQAQKVRPEIVNRTGYTPGQWALLPEWCRFTQDNPDAWRAGIPWDRFPGADRWIAVLGKDMEHLHHYCRGMRAELVLNTAPDLSAAEKTTLNEAVIVEMDYILRTCKATMPLMPEVLLRKADALMRTKDLARAQETYEASRRLKPDYWPAYDRWIAVLLDLKQFTDARALAEEGLRNAPDQPELLQRLKEVGEREAKATHRAKPAGASK